MLRSAIYRKTQGRAIIRSTIGFMVEFTEQYAPGRVLQEPSPGGITPVSTLTEHHVIIHFAFFSITVAAFATENKLIISTLPEELQKKLRPTNAFINKHNRLQTRQPVKFYNPPLEGILLTITHLRRISEELQLKLNFRYFLVKTKLLEGLQKKQWMISIRWWRFNDFLVHAYKV
jgi:hypothetical protein